MTDSELKKYVKDKFPDQPNAQQAYVDKYSTERNVVLEREKRSYDTALSTAFEQIASGGKLSDLSISARSKLSPSDIRKLQAYTTQISKQDDAQIESENYMAVTELSNPDVLESISQADIQKLRLNHKLSKSQYATLIKQKRKYDEQGETAVFAFGKQYPKVTLHEYIKKYLNIDVYSPLNEKEKRTMAIVNYNLQQLGQEFLDAAQKDGKGFVKSDFTPVLIKALQEKVNIEDGGFMWLDKEVRKITQPEYYE